MTSQTFLVSSSRIAELTKKLEKIARKVQKLNLEGEVSFSVDSEVVFKTYRKSEDEWVPCDPGYEFAVKFPFQNVTVSGPTPRLGGWTFAGTLQHLTVEGETTNILRTLREVPAHYRNATPACDHCNINRRRNDTYLVVNEAGEWKQVGRTCLQDFVGGKDPADVVAMLTGLLSMCASAESEGGFGGGISHFHLESFLLMVVRAMEFQGGFVSRSMARDRNLLSTSDLAMRWLFPKNREEEADRNSVPEKGAHRAKVDEILEFGMEMLDNADRNDYLHNLWVAMNQPVVTHRTAGIVASVFSWYDRETGKAAVAKHQKAVSDYVGEVKGKVELSVTVESVKLIDGFYGAKLLHKMVDTEGNVLVWWCSGKGDLEVGKTYNVKASVKSHEEYNGVKQTTLLRVTTK